MVLPVTLLNKLVRFTHGVNSFSENSYQLRWGMLGLGYS